MIHGVIIGLDQCHRGLYMLLEKGFCVEETIYAPHEYQIAKLKSQ